MGSNWGGPWTEIKLEVLKRYLQFYTTALKIRNSRESTSMLSPVMDNVKSEMVLVELM